MWDAESPVPVCGDTYAKLFMGDEGLSVLERFRPFARPNTSNLFRHRIIDEHLVAIIKKNPFTRIFIIGAGFDSRAYRLPGGEWFEVDEPELISLKEDILPAMKCGNKLTRVAVDFANEKLDESLSAFRTPEQVVVVIEGVLLYLDRAEMERLLDSLKNLFPSHTLICEIMKQRFFERYTARFHEVLMTLGTQFRYIADEQGALFIEKGYKLKEKASIVGRAVQERRMNIPRFVMPLMKTLRDGYTVCVFEYRPEGA